MFSGYLWALQKKGSHVFHKINNHNSSAGPGILYSFTHPSTHTFNRYLLRSSHALGIFLGTTEVHLGVPLVNDKANLVLRGWEIDSTP